jgi:hypothetical protein
MIYRAFDKQIAFHTSPKRFRGAFAGKRGGKTECGAVEAIRFTEHKIGYKPNNIDPYVGIIIAPTSDMLRRLSLKKFLAYAKPFKHRHLKSLSEVHWHNDTIIYGISADKPERMEGIKANFAWIDEVFQVDKQIYLEAQARVSDNEGHIWCTGSLGVQYHNPRQHWCYEEFKSDRGLNNPDNAVFEWGTINNPYFPRKEIRRLKETLDPQTFRQMYELSWDVPGSALVYGDFNQANVIRGYQYNPNLETYVSIDWGWAHYLACLFFQYDPKTDTVYLFDEIVQSKLLLEQLWARIKAKGYQIKEYYCDIAGNQEREQTGISNVTWFKKNANIHFRYRSTAIQYGIPIVRTYIKNGLGQSHFYVDEVRCPKSLDGIKTYSYPEKNGVIINENPVKKDDDCVDAARYFFVNRLDFNRPTDTFQQFSKRW